MKMRLRQIGQLTAMTSLFAAMAAPISAQLSDQTKKPLPPPAVNWTAAQDHQNMMDQLGIKTLRPGPSGNESAPNHANYGESKANPWPNYPDSLTLKNGQKVTAPEMWWKQRRPEILADFDSEMYGRVPKNVPAVTWSVKLTDHEVVGRVPVIARHLIGHVDNSSYPLIDVNIDMVVVTPANAHGPVPVLMMFSRPVLPAPAQPNPEELATLNAALRAMLAKSDPSLVPILDKYPAYEPMSAASA
ncbi:MAG: acetylxylan esterase, partial [Granulicella sp.]